MSPNVTAAGSWAPPMTTATGNVDVVPALVTSRVFIRSTVRSARRRDGSARVRPTSTMGAQTVMPTMPQMTVTARPVQSMSGFRGTAMSRGIKSHLVAWAVPMPTAKPLPPSYPPV